MVNNTLTHHDGSLHRQRRYQEEPGGPPPPMDESWWEAVMAEDETQHAMQAQGKAVYPSGNEHANGSAYRQGKASGGRHMERPALPVEPRYRPAIETEQTMAASMPAASMPVSHMLASMLPVDAPAYSDQEYESDSLDWRQALELFEQDQVVHMIVTGCNRGGLLVNGDHLQGFVPVSHLVETPCTDYELERWLERYLHRTMELKVIECDQERGRVVFSERAAQARPGSRKILLQNLHAGDCITGAVTNITDFGVFVDLGGVEGLVHVSEISWGRVHHPADVVSLGEQVEVFVIQVDPERARIALSLKRLHPNPWETAESRYYPGQVAEATVTSIVPFGAFARLEEGLDGLIHISELGPANSLASSGGTLQEGQRLKVRILHVDASRQRLGLSLQLDD